MNVEDPHKRLFILSSDLFTGFRLDISLYEVSTIEDITNHMKQKLYNILEQYNFTNLINELNKKNFHIHSYSIEDILISKPESIFYICDHC
tara:strand:- start:3156 stop:3428 length:273 start_codon:yes stop_codon:yes gene_type:complete